MLSTGPELHVYTAIESYPQAEKKLLTIGSHWNTVDA